MPVRLRTISYHRDKVEGVPTALKFSMADTSDWYFAGGGKESAPPQTGEFGTWIEENETGWLRPASLKATPEDGMIAIHTKTAFTTFNVSFDFVVGQGPKAECWSSPAFVFAAKDAQHFKTLEFPVQGQQNRAEHFWAQVNSVRDSSGWRESLSMQGPIHGVTSGNSWPHAVRATLGSDGLLFAWIDGRPLQPVQVGTAAGYLGLTTYNILANDAARVKNVQVVGQSAPSAKPFDKSIGMGRGFVVVPGTDPGGDCKSFPCNGVVGDSRHVGHMVRAPNGDLIAPNGGTQLRTKDNAKTWQLDDPRPSGIGWSGHMMQTTEKGKPALASFLLKGPTPPCPDCGAPVGSVWKLLRSVSVDSGLSWDNGTLVQELMPPPVSCEPTAFGPKPPVDCDKLTWRFDEGINSILPLRDGKTVLLFAVAHNGDLGLINANQRTYYYSYQKEGANGTASPVPSLGYPVAMRSTDAGHSFGQLINLDGPWTEQSSMFPKGEPMQGLELSPFETKEGNILVLDRPASSPWMWESWATPNTPKPGALEFGPSTRGPFPLYACFDATITTSSGALLICGRYPALTCQLSFDSGAPSRSAAADADAAAVLAADAAVLHVACSGMTWKGWTIDVSGIWAQGAMVELEPDVVLFTYGGRGPGAGAKPWSARYQKLRVDPLHKTLTHVK